jgi:hypothetical protein
MNTVRVLTSKGIRWAGYVTHTGEMRNTQFWLGSLKGTEHLKKLYINGITLEWLLMK